MTGKSWQADDSTFDKFFCRNTETEPSALPIAISDSSVTLAPFNDRYPLGRVLTESLVEGTEQAKITLHNIYTIQIYFTTK